jgi:hypothetical protein
MTTPNIRPGDKQSTDPESEQEATEAKNPNRIIMFTVITLIAFSVGVGLAINFFVPAYISENRVMMIYSGAGIVIFATIGIASQLLANAPPIAAPRQDDTARIALKNLVEQNEIQSRPYIDAIDPVLSPLIVGQTAVVRVTIKNTGKTPAVDVMVGSRVQIGDFPLFTDTNYQAIDAPRVTLGAGQSATIDTPADQPLTEDELVGLKSGMKWLKAHGEIVFTADPAPKTPFKHPHFCFVLERLGEPMQVCDNFGDHADQGVFREDGPSSLRAALSHVEGRL